MSTRQLQIQAYREWQASSDIQRKYLTFDFYWWERYARVYRLDARVRPFDGAIH
jgi:hypothetical protein